MSEPADLPPLEDPGDSSAVGQTDPVLSAEPDRDDRIDPSAVSAKVVRYVQRLMDRYDRNGDGRLQEDEWRQMQGKPEQADRDGNGVIELEELLRHIAEYGRERRIRLLPPQPGDLVELPPLLTPTTDDEFEEDAPEEMRQPNVRGGGSPSQPMATENQAGAIRPRDTKFFVPASRLPSGLPPSFLSRDLDGDGQLTLSEFAPKMDRASVEEFRRLDRNNDGVITAEEYLNRAQSSETSPGRRAEK